MRRYLCFIITPIGQEGTERYQNFSDVREYIIRPALAYWASRVEWHCGNEYIQDPNIPVSVERRIREADFCICDVTEPNNGNVFYELGLARGLKKEVFLLRDEKTKIQDIPTDIRSDRMVEYSLPWDKPHLYKAAIDGLKSWVDQWLQKRDMNTNMNDEENTISPGESDSKDISKQKEEKIIDPMKKKIDIQSELSDEQREPVDELSLQSEEVQKNYRQFEKALEDGNGTIAGMHMKRLGELMERENLLLFYTRVVTRAAEKGIDQAGELLISYAHAYADSDRKFTDKIEYLRALDGYITRKGMYKRYAELMDEIGESLQKQGDKGEDIAQVQFLRSHQKYGLYRETGQTEDLKKAINILEDGVLRYEDADQYYNLAWYYDLLNSYEDQSKTTADILEQAIRMKEPQPRDSDRYKRVCTIYYHLKSPQYNIYLEKYRQENRNAANELESELENKHRLGRPMQLPDRS